MAELKPLSREAIPAALEKAERYRLLNEPAQAESICRDILRVDAESRPALATLLLALTDQFGRPGRAFVNEARAVLERLGGPYESAYYQGLICERQGTAQIRQGGPGADAVAHNWLREALTWYERAEAVRPADNDDAILRWNACVRQLRDHGLVPRAEDEIEQPLE
ncbi:MAG: hypothetical protein ABR559_07400 [Gemmatimonadota bacterium]